MSSKHMTYGFKLILRFDSNDEDDDVQTIEEVILEGSMKYLRQLWNTELENLNDFRSRQPGTKAENDAKAIARNDWYSCSNSI